MLDPVLFKWRHFEADVILCTVRWYPLYALSARDVEELLRERGMWSITPQSFAGSNAMLPNWRNATVRS
jgi:hypothetical protein